MGVRSDGPQDRGADTRPIGVFDSGFGGLTVAKAMYDLVPNENFVYLGDTGRYPYGPRPLGEVRRFVWQIAKYLIAEHDVKMLVVACNTASAAALEDLKGNLDVPVVGVIEPGVRATLKVSETGKIGVIGTVGTISSGAYQSSFESLGQESGMGLTCCACPGFVEFVERGETDTDQVHVLAERLLSPLKQAGVDTLLLGCTHYPFLARTIADVMGRGVVLVSSADETAFEVRSILRTDGNGGEPGGTKTYLSSGDCSWFRRIGSRLLGEEIGEVTQVSWD